MTEMLDLPDRERIRSCLDESLFVEAGAGTGKTSELVARILGLITSGRSTIDRIVAITFTEASAGELRARVRHALESAVADETLPDASRARCAVALEGVEEAAIQTIHAFARRVLQLHPTEAGLPPVFSVVDEVTAHLTFSRAWKGFLDRSVLTSNDVDPALDELLRAGFALGLQVRHLAALAHQLDGQWDRVRDWLPKARSEEPFPVVDVSSTLAALSALEGLLPSCLDQSDPMAVRISRDLSPWRQRLESASVSGIPGVSGDRFAMISTLASAPKLTTRIGAKGRWAPGVLEQVRSCIEVVAAEREAVLAPVRNWSITRLAVLVADFVMSVVQHRVAMGELQFHDLLVLARDMLRDDEKVRRSVRARFSYFLVDEFQDTDPLQSEIIEALCVRGGDSGALFTVGDPKQSIYRFRNADIEQYIAMRDRTGGNRNESASGNGDSNGDASGDDENENGNPNTGRVVALQTNFRTLPGVVGWINEVFESMLEDGSLGTWRPLHAGRSSGAHLGSVAFVGGPTDRSVRAAELREREAQEIVERIVAVKAGRWPIAGSNSVRAAQYQDIAVLMPTRAPLPALERAMRRTGVPYRIESRSLVWATQELRDILAILRAIEDPCNEVAIVAALRTPVFACGDDDLLAWRRSGGAWDYRVDEEPIDLGDLRDRVETKIPQVVRDGLLTLRDLHVARWWKSVSELIDEVYTRTNMFETAFARCRRRETWNRLRFFLDCARRWQEEGGDSLHGFLAWVDGQIERGVDVLESVVPEADDDAVRVMTIHAAKGLEFPVTFVCGLGSVRVRLDSVRTLWRGRDLELRIGPAVNGWETPGFSSASLNDDECEAQEQARLLYVAATRARDHLVLSTFHQQEKTPKCLAGRLLAAAEGVDRAAPRPMADEEVVGSGITNSNSADPSVTLSDAGIAHVADSDVADSDVGAPAVLSRTAPMAGANSPSLHEYAATLERERWLAVRSGCRPVALSATAITRRMSGDDAVLPGRTITTLEPDDLAHRLAFGRAVHAVIERVSLDGCGLDELAKIAAEEESLLGRAADIAHSVRLALESDPVREARSGRHWREMFVTSAVGDLVIEGYADLVYERTDDTLVVIDYKTDPVSSQDEAGALLQHYRWQLLTYAMAIMKATGKTVSRVALLLINPANRQPIVVSLDEVGEGCAELEGALSSV